ncbi:hypothetical protein tb265_22620 [Gemmatimonadetes bacterium T265]|nr:hypothetical protein tb265_22620 [Gemmatimonadetes bacterium T265]
MYDRYTSSASAMSAATTLSAFIAVLLLGRAEARTAGHVGQHEGEEADRAGHVEHVEHRTRTEDARRAVVRDARALFAATVRYAWARKGRVYAGSTRLKIP